MTIIMQQQLEALQAYRQAVEKYGQDFVDFSKKEENYNKNIEELVSTYKCHLKSCILSRIEVNKRGCDKWQEAKKTPYVLESTKLMGLYEDWLKDFVEMAICFDGEAFVNCENLILQQFDKDMEEFFKPLADKALQSKYEKMFKL